jgi:hypothetical protein
LRDHEVNVTGVAHAARDEGVGGLLDERLVDVAGKSIPGVPTHRRRQREPFELLGESGGGGAKQNQAGEA